MGLFSSSIPPWFVLSSNLSTTNTRAIWLCFGAFLSPPVPSLRIQRPLATGHCSRATDHHSPVPRSTRHAGTSGFRSCADPSPLATAWRRQPDWQSPDRARSRRALPFFQYGTKPGDAYGKIHPFFLARRRWTVDHSLAAGGAQRQGGGRAAHFLEPRKRGLSRLPGKARAGASQGLLAPKILSGKMYT